MQVMKRGAAPAYLLPAIMSESFREQERDLVCCANTPVWEVIRLKKKDKKLISKLCSAGRWTRVSSEMLKTALRVNSRILGGERYGQLISGEPAPERSPKSRGIQRDVRLRPEPPGGTSSGSITESTLSLSTSSEKMWWCLFDEDRICPKMTPQRRTVWVKYRG